MSTSLVADYLFEGSYQIRTIQNGTSYSTNEGKSVAGGLVGKGIIDLGGTNEKRSKIAIASPTSSLIIQADQSKLSKTGDGLTINDKEHASAALIFGSVGTNNINVSNIDIYTNNTTIKNGAYPLQTSYYIVIRKDEEQGSNTRKLVDAMLSARGQAVAEEVGYVRTK